MDNLDPKKKKKILLIVFSFLMTLIVFCVSLFLFDLGQYGFDWDTFISVKTGEQFLRLISKNDLNRAFGYLYLYEDDIDNGYQGNREDVKQKWIDRVNSYKENDIYLESFRKMTVVKNEDDNDDILKLSVEIRIYDQAKVRVYMTNMIIVKKDGRHMVASISDNDIMDFYEYAISGNIK